MDDALKVLIKRRGEIQAKLKARTGRDGNPLPGFKVNVEECKKALASIEEKIAVAEAQS